MSIQPRWRGLAALLVFGTITSIDSSAQTFKRLLAFNGANGLSPQSPLVQGTDGDFYGTAAFGGSDNGGTVFKISPSGAISILHTFAGYANGDGGDPNGPLIEGIDGNFYGTTADGGRYGCSASNGCGTVFEITPAGVMTIVYSFQGSDGSSPLGGLVAGIDGSFYGTTYSGGANGYGTVFKITHQGVLTPLYNFFYDPELTTAGVNPNIGLVAADDGNFYGVTYYGGIYTTVYIGNGYGRVFKITPAGVLTTIHSFDSTDGAAPNGLVLSSTGNLYGTTYNGGAGDTLPGYGTVFEMTLGGTLTTLHQFIGNLSPVDGVEPYAGVALATDGNLYGTTVWGGSGQMRNNL